MYGIYKFIILCLLKFATGDQGEQNGIGMHVEIDNNLFRFIHHELEKDLKKIITNLVIDFKLDEEKDGAKDIQMPVGHVVVKDFSIKKLEINENNELEIEVSNITFYNKVWV